MPKAKIAIALDAGVLARLDDFVKRAGIASRSQAVEAAIEEKLERVDRTRLVRECANLDPAFEKGMAEEGLGEDLAEWPVW